jgi:hemolysin III
MTPDDALALRPRLRGVSHQYAFFLSLVAGAALVASASGGREIASTAVFAGALTAMFGVSAVYHRVTWRPAVRVWMRRLDHAAIYLLIAGTYTPFGLLALPPAWAAVVLSIVWSGCALAIVLKLVWVDAPKWLAAALAVALGWVGVIALPELASAGAGPLVLLTVGGVLYTAGALVYALQRPDPIPAVFGYHELFHALVIAAAACQYAAVLLLVFREV